MQQSSPARRRPISPVRHLSVNTNSINNDNNNNITEHKTSKSSRPSSSSISPQNEHYCAPNKTSKRRHERHSNNNNNNNNNHNKGQQPKISTRTKCLPHGLYILLPVILSTAAWILSLIHDSCNYSRVTGTIIYDLTGDVSIPFASFGYNTYRLPTYDDNNNNNNNWYMDYSQSCQVYDPKILHLGFTWRLSRYFAFLALILGGSGAIFLWFTSCFVFSPVTWKWTGYEIFIASIFQSLSFLWFVNSTCIKSGNSCYLSLGAVTDIVAAGLWLVSAFIILVQYPNPSGRVKMMGKDFVMIEQHTTDLSDDVSIRSSDVDGGDESMNDHTASADTNNDLNSTLVGMKKSMVDFEII